MAILLTRVKLFGKYTSGLNTFYEVIAKSTSWYSKKKPDCGNFITIVDYC